MDDRQIPSLVDSTNSFGVSRLLQSTLIIRHGARTPWSGDIQCWEDYGQNDAWNCNLTTLLAPPSPNDVEREEGHATNGHVASFFFEKQYLALHNPPTLRNELNGTCQKGQLLLRGYEQELANGQHLRQAYLYSSNNFDHDVRMRLIDVHEETTPWKKHVYYRADDDQRTLMSGQVLLRALFEPELEVFVKDTHTSPIVPLITADRSRDILAANEQVCPRLAEMRERFHRTSKFMKFNNSEEAQELRRFLRRELGVDRMDSIDCLFTTMCTDRDLPDAVSDYTPNDNSTIFSRLVDFEARGLAMLYTANDAQYSKLAIGPLWAEIFANIDGILYEQDTVCCPQRSTPKLALFSGHDTTIMPLLAAIGAFRGEWPPYASMVAIEIHRVHIDGTTDKSLFKSNFAFRLLYNGRVITDRVTGCPPDVQLCDAQVLRNLIVNFASLDNMDCARRYVPPVEYEDTISRAAAILSTPGGVIAVILLVMACIALGAGVMFVYMTGRIPVVRKDGNGVRRPRRRQYETVSSNGDGGGGNYGSNSDNDGLHYDESFVIDDDDNEVVMEANGGSEMSTLHDLS